jgi:hypothetical protein
MKKYSPPRMCTAWTTAATTVRPDV